MTRCLEIWLDACGPEKWKNDEQRDKKIQGKQVAEVTGTAVNLAPGQGRRWGGDAITGASGCTRRVYFLPYCVHRYLLRLKSWQPLFNKTIRPLRYLSIPALSAYEAAVPELAGAWKPSRVSEQLTLINY